MSAIVVRSQFAAESDIVIDVSQPADGVVFSHPDWKRPISRVESTAGAEAWEMLKCGWSLRGDAALLAKLMVSE